MKNLEQKIPLHILFISLFFPTIDYKKKYGKDEPTVNEAKGEIEKINLNSKYPKEIGDKVERPMWENRVDYDTTWIHLGQNYFKQISRTKASSC